MNERLQFNESLEIRMTPEELRTVVCQDPWLLAKLEEVTDTEEWRLKAMNEVLFTKAHNHCGDLHERLVSWLHCRYLHREPVYVYDGFCYNASDSIITMCQTYPHHIAELAVRLTSDRITMRLEVEDNGIGVDTDVERDLFTKHICSQKAGNEIFNGGYGVHMHGARIRIENLDGNIGCINKGHERGAIFWYEIPLDAIIPAGMEVLK